jgi:hypothetical protein
MLRDSHPPTQTAHLLLDSRLIILNQLADRGISRRRLLKLKGMVGILDRDRDRDKDKDKGSRLDGR